MYTDVGRAARGFAARLATAGVRKGDKVVFWGENRPEWIVAFWGCLLGGVIVVPDRLPRVGRVPRRVSPRIVAAQADPRRRGRAADADAAPDVRVWSCTSSNGDDGSAAGGARSTRDDVVEIIFTSGATAEPKGVVITHRNVLANIVPVEREVMKYRK